MLAVLGAIIPEFFTFPFYDGPHLFTRGHDWGVHNGSLSQVLFFTSIFEIMTTPAIIQMVRGQSGMFSLNSRFEQCEVIEV